LGATPIFAALAFSGVHSPAARGQRWHESRPDRALGLHDSNAASELCCAASTDASSCRYVRANARSVVGVGGGFGVWRCAKKQHVGCWARRNALRRIRARLGISELRALFAATCASRTRSLLSAELAKWEAELDALSAAAASQPAVAPSTARVLAAARQEAGAQLCGRRVFWLRPGFVFVLQR
jgi:hypothetical protein